MPLHLLPKKSWNVYNSENIARVRADEAAAAAAEAAEEQRLQEEDAARRLAILRGEEPPPTSRPTETTDTSVRPKRPRDSQDDGGYRDRKRRPRKRRGEDDTDFELRLARERQEQASALRLNLRTTTEAPITDDRGNISLFAIDPSSESFRQPNPEAEADRRNKQERDDTTLRFSHASGRDKSVISKTAPWYQTSAHKADALVHTTGTNAFGQPDPERHARDAKRLDAADPLALMKQGARKVREIKKEREKEQEERIRDTRRLEKEQRRERRERRRKRRERRATGDPVEPDTDEDSLERFSLDASSKRKSSKDEHDTYRGNHRKHRHRDYHDRKRSDIRRSPRS